MSSDEQVGGYLYEIRNVMTDECYIGKSAAAPGQRWASHLGDLTRGDHSSDALQAAWREYGPEAFAFRILERCATSDELAARESTLIAELQPAYNTAGTEQGRMRMQAKTAQARALMRAVSPAVKLKAALTMTVPGARIGLMRCPGCDALHILTKTPTGVTMAEATEGEVTWRAIEYLMSDALDADLERFLTGGPRPRENEAVVVSVRFAL